MSLQLYVISRISLLRMLSQKLKFQGKIYPILLSNVSLLNIDII